MPVKVPLVNPLGRSVKVSASIPYSLCLVSLALLPLKDVFFTHFSIKGNDGKGRKLSQLVESREELNKHLVINTTRLVNTNSELSVPLYFLAWVNVREPLVDSTNSRFLICFLRSFNKVSKSLLPVDADFKALHDFLTARSRNTSPRARLVCFLSSLLDGFFQTLFCNFIFSVIDIIPAGVIVKGVAWVT